MRVWRNESQNLTRGIRWRKRKNAILEQFKLFMLGSGGIGSWFGPTTDDDVFARLGELPGEPLTKVQLNQLLVLGREAPVSDDFFRYYWLTVPKAHPYNVDKLPGYDQRWTQGKAIASLEHLHWGLTVFF